MAVVVRIVLGVSDQVRVYLPSAEELRGFVPAGQLLASLRCSASGYRVHQVRSDQVVVHEDFGQALRDAIGLDVDVSGGGGKRLDG